MRALDNSARLYLDGFVEPEMAASLGLSGYASESWMPLVGLLLSEQTTLAARPALRAAVSGIEAGTLGIVEAVRRYRLNDAVRPRLWGQHDRRLRLQLSADEDELAACLGDDSPAVPEALIQRILDGVKAQLDAVAQQGQRRALRPRPARARHRGKHSNSTTDNGRHRIKQRHTAEEGGHG